MVGLVFQHTLLLSFDSLPFSGRYVKPFKFTTSALLIPHFILSSPKEIKVFIVPKSTTQKGKPLLSLKLF